MQNSFLPYLSLLFQTNEKKIKIVFLSSCVLVVIKLIIMHVIVNKVQIREYNTAKSKKTMVVVLSMIHLAVLSPMTNPSRFTFSVAGCCDETA